MGADSSRQAPETLENLIDHSAYETVRQFQPSLLVVMGQLLDKGQTPQQIATPIRKRSTWLATIAESAASYMKAKGIRPAPTTSRSAAN